MITVEKISGFGSTKFLSYKIGVPFWADGVNVPYNYMSGYVEGLLAQNKQNFPVAKMLLINILENEFASGVPDIWRYWYGKGDNGWVQSDNISMNTPEWVGNRGGLAHITYRTMDAKALLALEKAEPNSLNNNLIIRLKELTQQGFLKPDMNEAWAKLDSIVDIDELVLIRHARSSSLWELQAQPWALDGIAKKMSKQ